VAYYLGIDGGGSKTTCVVGDESSITGKSTAGPSNLTRVSEDRARASLHEAIRSACVTAKIDPREIRRACVGAAGAARDDIAARVREIVAELLGGEIEVVGDMEIALAAAFGDGPGVIVIAGTGSIAYGRDAQGRTARAGGWGYAISDEGSAHWIGRAAVSTLLRSIDELMDAKHNAQQPVESWPLSREMQSAWNFTSLDQFLHAANSKADFAVLFPGIVSACERGDPLAEQILTQAGEELARLTAIVLRRLFAEDGARRAVPLAVAGGVFQHSRRVRAIFCDRVRRLDSRVELKQGIIEPVMGALQMARGCAPAK
jgi:glucosamine kinase